MKNTHTYATPVGLSPSFRGKEETSVLHHAVQMTFT